MAGRLADDPGGGGRCGGRPAGAVQHAADRMAGPQRPQGGAGREVVPGVPGPLGAGAERGERRVVLRHEGPAGQRGGRRQRTVGQIQVQRTHHVEPRPVREEPELGAGPRIEVEQVVRARGVLAAEVQVEDAAVAERRRQPFRQRLHGGVRGPAAHRGQPRPARPGAQLAARAAAAHRPGPVRVPVEEPVLVRRRRQERLEQQSAARLLGAAAQRVGLPRRAQYRRAAQVRTRGQQPGAAPLRDHGQPEAPDRGGRLCRGVGRECRRMRDARGLAHGGQFGLVGDAFGETGGGEGKQIAGREGVPHPVHRDRARVIHWDQYGGTGHPGRHSAQRQRDVGGRGVGCGRRMHPVDKARSAHRTSGGIGDHVHIDSGPAEGAYGSQRSVVKGIPVDSQKYGGNTGVEGRHGHISLRSLLLSLLMSHSCG